ncbi:hypothetical protein [Kribbella italica]|uniref:Uncharacterized protein n=1 Tax=Kribbella italica TaxID=1540520 RepID=A0A7W9J7V1_9ACTN|nr:hypothetical protein [Kribbella italica]MBB5837232.1 hypothetical protein [Kribbella italica]
MMTNMTMKPKFAGDALPCALIPGAVSRLHVETVVLTAKAYAPIQGGAVGDVKRGGSGSRSWSPPV